MFLARTRLLVGENSAGTGVAYGPPAPGTPAEKLVGVAGVPAFKTAQVVAAGGQPVDEVEDDEDYQDEQGNGEK